MNKESKYEDQSKEFIFYDLVENGIPVFCYVTSASKSYLTAFCAIMVSSASQVYMVNFAETEKSGGKVFAEATCISDCCEFSKKYRCTDFAHDIPVKETPDIDHIIDKISGKDNKTRIDVSLYRCADGKHIVDITTPRRVSYIKLDSFPYASVIGVVDINNELISEEEGFADYVNSVKKCGERKEEKNEVHLASTIMSVLKGNPIYLRQVGTSTMYGIILSDSNILYMFESNYLGENICDVFARCVDPVSSDFGCEFIMQVSDSYIKGEDEWKPVDQDKSNVYCWMAKCTDGNYALRIKRSGAELDINCTVGLSSEAFGKICSRCDERSERITFDQYLSETVGFITGMRTPTEGDIDKLDNAFKNAGNISWNTYFMAIAKLAAKRSKDPSTKVGAVIINPDDNRIVSVGYNGFPYGCGDKEFPWLKGKDLQYSCTKYAYVVHAELNAILSARGRDLTGCHIYVTSSPCNECTKAIIQSGIKKVVYLEEYNPGSEGWIASAKMCKAAGVEMEIYKKDGVNIDLGEL